MSEVTECASTAIADLRRAWMPSSELAITSILYESLPDSSCL
jgi:hypothetical protein